uniref:Large ribosomal subunit protein bL33m n=1 Tax=Felis catus TaxID=9685 RepID=A0ABI7X153_FELCA
MREPGSLEQLRNTYIACGFNAGVCPGRSCLLSDFFGPISETVGGVVAMFLSAVTFAKSKSKTILVKMLSQAGTGYSFNTKRSRLREKLTLLHYDPIEQGWSFTKTRKNESSAPRDVYQNIPSWAVIIQDTQLDLASRKSDHSTVGPWAASEVLVAPCIISAN